MSISHQYHDGDDWVVITTRIPTEGWSYRENAEEGDAGRSTIAMPDAALDFEPTGHRPYRVIENTSEADDDVLFGGFTWNNTTGRKQEDEVELFARAIGLQIDDANNVWQRPVMVGSDCNRPDETDVERMEWLLGTNELAIIDDVTTYFHSGSPVNMDANDYRGQNASQIMRDCIEQSGKNAWLKLIGGDDGRLLRAWYGRDSHSTYDSPLFLSNDPLDWSDDELLDGTSLVWPGAGWNVERDYSRIYCSIYAQYDGGATFVHSSGIHTAYFNDVGPDSHRTMTVPMPNVHRLATAKARAARMLADLDDPDIHVTATVRLPAAKATMLRAGMRVPIKLVHEPEFSDAYKWCRIVNASVSPAGAGSLYDIAIEATPTGPPDSDGPAPDDFAGGVFAGLQRSSIYGVSSPHAVGYASTYVPGDAEPGWDVQDTDGPIHIEGSVDPWGPIVADEPMTVAIYAAASGSNVYVPAVTMALSITVNGSPVATDSRSTGTGFQAWTRSCEAHNVHLDAGDEVYVEGTLSDDWGSVGVNTTYLVVVRGNDYVGSTGFAGP